jgi:hypothetical protein
VVKKTFAVALCKVGKARAFVNPKMSSIFPAGCKATAVLGNDFAVASTPDENVKNNDGALWVPVKQPHVPALMRHRWDNFSVARLMNF